jgi:GPH family glycoside/pentoside/hexuronide:cation symporter
MEKPAQQKNSTISANGKIPLNQLAVYGSGGIIPIALFNVAGILVGLMGNISLGLSAFWLGLILIIPRLWDAVSDPIIGHFSDNMRSKWGRRRPFILIGGILVAVFFVVLWWIPKGEAVKQWFPNESGFQVFQLVYILVALLLFFTATSLFEIPHGALGMEMTTDYHERTRLFSAKSFVGNLFAMSTPWLFALANLQIFKGTGGNEADGMRYVSLMIAALLIPLSFWWFFRLKEPGFKKVKTQKKTRFWADMRLVISNRNFLLLTMTVFTLAMGFNFVQLLGSYIPIFFIYSGDKIAGATLLGINGTVWAITGVLAVFPLNIISPRLGKQKTLVIAMLLMITAQLSKIVCYNPDYPYLIIIPTMLLSVGMLFFFTLGSSMVGDICDEEELKTGKRTEGSYYAVFWWFIKVGSALASFVAGILIVFTMFDEAQVTKVDKLQGNINELSELIEKYEKSDIQNIGGQNPGLIIEISAAIKEADDYIKYLKNEMSRTSSNQYKYLDNFNSEKTEILSSALSSIENARDYLENLSLVDSGLTGEPISVNATYQSLIQTRLAKAGYGAFDLRSSIRNQTLNPKIIRKEESLSHYTNLLNNINNIDISLAQIRNAEDRILDKSKIEKINKRLVAMRKQSPFTLLMMRVVEIGIPVLLSLMSMFFILRYTLTEKRLLEIKELLQQRNNVPENAD